MEKFLQTHGFKLSSVLSDISSVSGMNILCLLAEKGSLTIAEITAVLKGRHKHTADEIQQAICGTLNANECFLLQDFINEVRHIQEHITKILEKMQEIAEPYREVLERLDSIPGIDTIAALLILAEVGDSPNKSFRTSRHLCSWAGLAPRNDESAGKIKSKKILPGNPYVKSILCQVAWVAVKNRKSPLGNWFWSHQGKLGKKKAIIAVSRKILTLCYALISNNTFYDINYISRPLTE